MRKGCVFLFFAMFVLFGSLVVLSSGNVYSGKIDSKILEKFDAGQEKVKVIVNVKVNDPKKGLRIFSGAKEKGREEVISEIGEEKIRHRLSNDSFSAELTLEEIEKLADRGDILNSVWPVKLYLQDSAPLINATASWDLQESELNLTGQGQTVCVLDTGINFSHPDLQGKNLSCNIDCVNNSCVEDCSVTDDHGHGTHVGGIVSANGGIKGVAPGANLIGVKVLDSTGSGDTDDVVAGMQWCIDNADTYNISVISMSLGCNETVGGYLAYCDSSNLSDNACGRKDFTEKINSAIASNISVVSATGNDYWEGAIGAPACIQNATRVGSSTKVDAMSSFSNRWNLSMILAPGSLINSTRWNPGGDIAGCVEEGDYMTCSGTSMSTPHVAGAIAIINQFLSLTGQSKTPLEIETVLNDTGVEVDDSGGSGKNYSRIDIYSAVISLDNSNPVVTLVSPENGSALINGNQTFSCNATDLSLKNVTLYVWNSSGIYNTSSEIISGFSYTFEVNLTGIPSEDYEWNCLFYDENLNSAWASENYTLLNDTTPPTIEITNPENSSWLDQNKFNLTTNENSSCWFSVNEETNISMVSTDNINFGYLNDTLDESNLTTEYNVSFFCNDTSGNLNDSLALIYFGIDKTFPNATLVSPASGYSTTSTNISFQFNVSQIDNRSNISNCELIISGTSNSTTQNTTAVSLNSTNTVARDLTPGNYDWKINCSDEAGNEFNSSARSLTITAVVTSSSSGGGSSSSSSSSGGAIVTTASVVSISVSEVSDAEGYSDSFAEGDKIEFELPATSSSNSGSSSSSSSGGESETGIMLSSSGSGKTHTVTVEEILINKNKARIIIQSDPVVILLGIGEERKLSLDTGGYYDFYIKLNSITNGKADITVKAILEIIPEDVQSNDSAEVDVQEGDFLDDVFEDFFRFKSMNLILWGLLILVLLFAALEMRKILPFLEESAEGARDRYLAGVGR